MIFFDSRTVDKQEMRDEYQNREDSPYTSWDHILFQTVPSCRNCSFFFIFYTLILGFFFHRRASCYLEKFRCTLIFKSSSFRQIFFIRNDSSIEQTWKQNSKRYQWSNQSNGRRNSDIDTKNNVRAHNG